MRISDWSSDVCSSDLAAQHLGPDHPGHGGVCGIGGAAGDLVGAVRADRALADPLVAGVAGHVVHRAASRMSAAVSMTARTILSRSEEHTSELQSLMRISYAVFCLKKKKKINKTHEKINTSDTSQHDISMHFKRETKDKQT